MYPICTLYVTYILLHIDTHVNVAKYIYHYMIRILCHVHNNYYLEFIKRTIVSSLDVTQNYKFAFEV